MTPKKNISEIIPETAPATLVEADVAIIGGGPAGMAALVALETSGLNLHIIDEQPALGGQIYRQPPAAFSVPRWLEGKLYDRGKKLLARAKCTQNAIRHFETTVLGIFEDSENNDGHLLWLSSPAGLTKLRAKRILIAPGCYDMPLPFPGWTLPGVMAAGGIQAFIKSQQLVPGDNILFVGSHPLQLIIADQVIKGGGKVAAVVFAQNRSQFLKAALAPMVILQHARKFYETAKVIWRLRKAGVPIIFNHVIASANGEDAVRSATLRRVGADGLPEPGSERHIECDRLGFCYGFLPSSELARQAGAEACWDQDSGGGWIIRHDGMMRSTVKGLYVAGEITGVAGAEVAAAEGALAAAAILEDTQKSGAAKTHDQIVRTKQVAEINKELARLRSFAGLLTKLARPSNALMDSLATADTLICRCESIRLQDFNATLEAAPHLKSADAVKLACRTGMGLCQGRYCAHTVTRRLAGARGIKIAEAGGFTPRPPVKPVPIKDLIG